MTDTKRSSDLHWGSKNSHVSSVPVGPSLFHSPSKFGGSEIILRGVSGLRFKGSLLRMGYNRYPIAGTKIQLSPFSVIYIVKLTGKKIWHFFQSYSRTMVQLFFIGIMFM